MSTGADEAGIGMFVLAAACIAVCIGAISLRLSLRFILSSRDGRPQRTRQMVKVSIRRTIVGVACLTVLVVGWRYREDAQWRASVRPSDCEHEESADARYTARYCYVASRIILSVYAQDSRQLLLEKTYKNDSHDPVRLYWEGDTLRYEDGDDLGTIHLPPTRFERLMAKLP